MTTVRRIVLDVLKPHQPNTLEFARSIAAIDSNNLVRVRVEEVDENTETVLIEVEGDDIQFEAIEQAIAAIGGSLHSIDEVEVFSDQPAQ